MALDPYNRQSDMDFFLDSTCDVGLIDMRQGITLINRDIGHGLFFNSTCDIGENKRQGHATLGGPPSRAPRLAHGRGSICTGSRGWRDPLLVCMLKVVSIC